MCTAIMLVNNKHMLYVMKNILLYMLGLEQLPREVSAPRPAPAQDQGPHVADTLRGRLPPQPQGARQLKQNYC